MIKKMCHVGISVSNLERSVRFYCELLGMRVEADEDFAGILYERILGLPGASGRVALLSAPGAQLELFEFVCPKPQVGGANRPVSDWGISHFCVEVEDIEATYRLMNMAGVVFHSAPIDFMGLAKATYGRDPDGNVFELMQVTARGTHDKDRHVD